MLDVCGTRSHGWCSVLAGPWVAQSCWSEHGNLLNTDMHTRIFFRVRNAEDHNMCMIAVVYSCYFSPLHLLLGCSSSHLRLKGASCRGKYDYEYLPCLHTRWMHHTCVQHMYVYVPWLVHECVTGHTLNSSYLFAPTMVSACETLQQCMVYIHFFPHCYAPGGRYVYGTM